MMMFTPSLFSIFDPSMSMLSSSWGLCAILVMSIPSTKWLKSNKKEIMNTYMKMFKTELEYTMSKKFKGSVLFTSSIFSTVAIFNFSALFPFIFSLTSHLSINLPMALTLWLAIMLFSWMNFMKNFLSHLIPSGTPIFLISFMVMVEILSNLIRPVALTFRLTANMMAGHLLLSLIGSAAISVPMTMTIIMGSAQTLLVIMEIGVSLIQAYVFSTLLMLYMSE